jgi:hypothetical protein
MERLSCRIFRNKSYGIMKKIITIIAVGVFGFIGTTVDADARPRCGNGYSAPQSTIYVSGYRHGRAVYTEKYFVGYDCWGRPVFRYRTVVAPQHNQNCRPTHYAPRGSYGSVTHGYRR